MRTVRHPARRTALALVLVGALGLGVLAGSVPAVADPATVTKVWNGKGSGTAEPAPASGAEGSAVFSFDTPATRAVAPGRSVFVPFTLSCYDGSENDLSLYFQDGNGRVYPMLASGAAWSGTPGSLETYTGAVEFVMPESDVYLAVQASGPLCVTTNGGELDLAEDVAVFTPLVIDYCDALPGEPLDLDSATPESLARTIQSPNGEYSTTWRVGLDATLNDASGSANGIALQDGAIDNFSAQASSTENTGFSQVPNCVSRVAGSPEDWGRGTWGGLRLTTQTYYFSTADLVRRTWRFINDSATAVSPGDVRIHTWLGTGASTRQRSEQAWGRVTSSSAADAPVVTTLWGGPGVTLQGDMAPSAAIGAGVDGAESDSSLWLARAGRFSPDYFVGIDERPINWGPGSQAPTVSTVEGDLNTDYVLPTLQPGETVTIVEFAHVQFWRDGGAEPGGQPGRVSVDLGFAQGQPYEGLVSLVSGTHLAPRSTWRAVLEPGGVELASGTADQLGVFGRALQMPAGLPAGTYRLTLTGLDADGVTQVADDVWFTLRGDGVVAAVSSTAPGTTPENEEPPVVVHVPRTGAGSGATLASTGPGDVTPAAFAALLLLLGGAALLVRRRLVG